MKLRALLIVLAACAALAPAEPLDLVVMVDISASMAPYFADVVDYFIADIMRGLLQDGDRFHLLSFAGLTEVEMGGLRIDGEERQRLVNKIRLLQPIGLYTDLVRAVLFLQGYTASVPAVGSRQIVLITDGVHDPPPTSPYAGDQAGAIARLLEGARSIRMNGWYVHILGLPLRPGAAGGAGPRSLLGPLAREFGGGLLPYTGPGKETIAPATAGLLELRWPGRLGRVGRSFNLPLAIVNNTPGGLSLTLSHVWHGSADLLGAPQNVTVNPGQTLTINAAITLPADLPAGDQVLNVRLETSGDARLYPLDGRLALTFDPGVEPRTPAPAAGAPAAGERAVAERVGPGTEGGPTVGDRVSAAVNRAASALGAAAAGRGRAVVRLPLALLASALLLLLALLLILAFGRRVGRSAAALLPRPVARRAEKGPLIEMQVSLQSSRIGFRNIRGIEAGRRRSVGGGWSAFLIFLVPLPRRIAEIRYDGVRYSFAVIRPRFFPTVPALIPDCLGVDIPLMSEKGFPIVLRFVRYISPLERIHSLLNAVYEQGVRQIPHQPSQPPAVDTAHRFL